MTDNMHPFEKHLREWGVIKDDPPPPRQRPVAAIISDRGSTDAYLDRALANEVERVATAAEGTRNHTLNQAAFNLGQLIAGAGLNQIAVVDALTDAARAVGLPDTEIRNTLRSGITAGTQQPRGVPELAPVPAGYTITVTDLEPAAPETDEQVRERFPALDWHALWADDSEEEWIVEPLLPARRLIALYSPPKVGKSLLMLELAVAIATGRPVLGVTIDRPRHVLYVDFENDPRADIRERLQAMRVGPDDLTERLHYLSFPSLAALDSAKGGAELLAAVRAYQADVVVIDTVSRAVAGEENENDTWLSFYRHTGLLLKREQVALVRLDHSGKDETKGQRGGSAKSGDVDAVWRFSKLTDTSYRLDCEANRMPITEKTLVLHRDTFPLRHRVEAEGRAAAMRIKADAYNQALDELGADQDVSNADAGRMLRSAGMKVSNQPLAEALRTRKLSFQKAVGTAIHSPLPDADRNASERRDIDG